MTKPKKKQSNLPKNSKKREENKERDWKEKENRLAKKEETLDAKQVHLDEEMKAIKEKIEEINALKEGILATKNNLEKEIETIARMSAEDARAMLLENIEKKYQEDLLVRMQKMEHVNREELERRSRDIMISAMQRYAHSVVNDVTTTSVTIPSEDAKGKIIGKEGRNIRTFERVSGTELIVDDTPDTVVIASFDPIRRQIARVALENLILDGRIQPAKIEEFIEKARAEINTIIKQKGEQAVYEVGILNFDPRITAILGRLYFRTSYGQNVLQHSVEMAHIAGMLAEQLGADPYVAKAGALVHDIGKALDHEVQGTHVQIGMRILRKFGADERVVTAMKSHHDEYPHESLESIIVTIADAISGSRPGARRDSVENYIKRLQELETVALGFTGVEKAFALSAGREVRVFVYPEQINDLQAKQLARSIAEQIEKDLKYPGEIKITLIRENRIVEFAR
ncbi:MAG: ribonuclease Y [Candidatus Pacebacteria bacterium]|nr:ribonuclease Y [Candidatus Paceibacterota bacterium]MCD8508045.1 ribonuclease Y [Candidatus Paceibacterota bacterium]